MTKTQFTPGPWYATQADDRFPVRIREESSDAVLATGDDGGHPDPEFAIPDDIIMANARLMAAAPELYDSIDVPNLRRAAEILKFAGSTLSAGLITMMADKQERALAKARGEER